MHIYICMCVMFYLCFVCNFHIYFFIYFLFFLSFLLFLWAAPATHGGSQARGLIGATAAGLHHSNARSELPRQPTAQLAATPDP